MIRKTITLYFVFSLIAKLGISFVAATYTIFLLSRGMNLFEVSLINVVFHATILLFEIPTGMVADMFGRKISFVVSYFLVGAGMFIYSIADSLPLFITAEACAAIGATFSSGALQAWFVDKLAYHKHNGPLMKLFGYEYLFIQFAAVIGAIVGALLYDHDSSLPWLIAGFVMSAGAALSIFLMKEEYFEKKKYSVLSAAREMRRICFSSFRYVRGRPLIKFILFFGAVQLFAVQAVNMQWQPLFEPFVPGASILGLIFMGIAISTGTGSLLAPFVSRYIGSPTRAIMLSQMIIAVGIIATVVTEYFPVMICMFFLHEVGRGIYIPLKNSYINRLISPQERATLLSFESMVCHGGSVLGLLISGFVAQHVSITAAWILSGGLMIVVSFVFLIRKKRKK